MNFILITRYKDSWLTLPMDKRIEIGTQLYAFAEKYTKAGKFKESYTFSDGRIMSIWSVESFEDMMTILVQHPYVINNYADYELAPVIDHKGVDKIFSSFGKPS